MAGTNETHTSTPHVGVDDRRGNVGLFAACASMQSVNPTLVPVIAVGNAPFGAAAGAPARRPRRQRRRHRRALQQRGLARRRRARAGAGRGALRDPLQGRPRPPRGGRPPDHGADLRDRQARREPPRQEPGRAAAPDRRPTSRATASTAAPPTKLSEIGQDPHHRRRKAFKMGLTQLGHHAGHARRSARRLQRHGQPERDRHQPRQDARRVHGRPHGAPTTRPAPARRSATTSS